jgi:hypothetical protein
VRVIANGPTAKDLKELGVASRRGEIHGTFHTSGYVQCASCGGTLGSYERIAKAIGVGSSSLSAWLNRRPVRPDIAAKIRSAFHRVEE